MAGDTGALKYRGLPYRIVGKNPCGPRIEPLQEDFLYHCLLPQPVPASGIAPPSNGSWVGGILRMLLYLMIMKERGNLGERDM